MWTGRGSRSAPAPRPVGAPPAGGGGRRAHRRPLPARSRTSSAPTFPVAPVTSTPRATTGLPPCAWALRRPQSQSFAGTIPGARTPPPPGPRAGRGGPRPAPRLAPEALAEAPVVGDGQDGTGETRRASSNASRVERSRWLDDSHLRLPLWRAGAWARDGARGIASGIPERRHWSPRVGGEHLGRSGRPGPPSRTVSSRPARKGSSRRRSYQVARKCPPRASRLWGALRSLLLALASTDAGTGLPKYHQEKSTQGRATAPASAAGAGAPFPAEAGVQAQGPAAAGRPGAPTGPARRRRRPPLPSAAVEPDRRHQGQHVEGGLHPGDGGPGDELRRQEQEEGRQDAGPGAPGAPPQEIEQPGGEGIAAGAERPGHPGQVQPQQGRQARAAGCNRGWSSPAPPPPGCRRSPARWRGCGRSGR